MVVKTNTVRVESACGNVFVTFAPSPNGNGNFFKINTGKTGECSSAFFDTISSLINVCLKYKAPIDEVMQCMRGVGCDKPTRAKYEGDKKPILMCSCIDHIGCTIQKCIKKEEIKSEHESKSRIDNKI